MPKYTPLEQAHNHGADADLRTVVSAPAAAQGSPGLEDKIKPSDGLASHSAELDRKANAS